MSLSMDVTTNHVTSSGFAYDANGNTTSIPSTPQNINLTYDVENRTGGSWYDQQNQPLNRAGVWNVYGLHGERMETDTFSYGLIVINNQAVGTYGTTTQASRNIYFAGRLIQSNGTTVVRDRTGSVRANENGQTFEYYPYGEEVTVQNPQDREKFATYTRESSTGLDYANQRYYASVYGRFNTPDRYQASAGPADPGSWNRYSYVEGDPINLLDHIGTCLEEDDGDWVDDSSEAFLLLNFDEQEYTPGSCWNDTTFLSQVAPYGATLDGVFYPAGSGQEDNSHQSAVDCQIGLFYRKAFLSFLPWNHTYLETECFVNGTVASAETIQADPGPMPVAGKPATATGWWGDPWLVGVILPPGTGPGNSGAGLPGNTQAGYWESISATTITNIEAAVDNYDYQSVQPYTLFPYGNDTYNSNSFINTLNVQFALGFSKPAGCCTPGWGNYTVPGL